MKFLTRLFTVSILTFACLTAVTTAATNYRMPGAMVQPGASSKYLSNDKPFFRWITPKTIGTSDTLFGVQDTGGIYKFNTSAFNSARNPIQNSNNGTTSAVVGTNPDSVVCKADVLGVGADSVTFIAGILDSLGSHWSAYGGSAVTTGIIATDGWHNIRFTAPWVSGAYFRPYFTISTSTDTATVSYLDCKDLNNH